MGRPLKKGLKYFNIDCVQEDNLNYVEAVHGIVGYGTLVKLWRKIYMIEGYYTEWAEKNLYLFAREINVEVQKVRAIIDSCFAEGIFSKSMYDRHQVLTSRGIQRRYIKIVTEAKRKDTEIDEKYRITDLTQEETKFPPEETPINQEDSTQKKRKESKRKETTESSGAVPAKPSPPKKSVGKQKEVEPFWQQLVDVWFSFVKEKFGESPLFAGEDPKFLKSIIGKLKKRAATRKIEWTEVTGPERLKIFLNYAFADKWRAEHFLLKTLDAKFEEIGRNKNMIAEQLKDHTGLEPEIEIQQLFEKFQQGKPNEMLITEKHFEYLRARQMISVTDAQMASAIHKRMNNLTGSNQAQDLRLLQAYEKNPADTSLKDPQYQKVLKRIVVMEFFYSLEKQNVRDVFPKTKAAV
jgi:hypothetical protein